MVGNTNDKCILYLHGGPGASCLDFHEQAIAIGRYHKIIAIDQYGVLRSDNISPNEECGMIKHIEILEQIRIKMKIERWSLLGHSYGGMLACLYASLHPKSIESVIYECPSFNFSYSTKSAAKFLLTYFEKTKNNVGITICHKIINRKYSNKDILAVTDMERLLAQVHDMQTRNYLHTISYEVYCSYLEDENISSDMWKKSETHYNKLKDDKKTLENFIPTLKQISISSLLIVGKYDTICSIEQIKDFISSFSKKNLITFEKSGHFPRLEDPDRYTKCICSFIDQLKLLS